MLQQLQYLLLVCTPKPQSLLLSLMRLGMPAVSHTCWVKHLAVGSHARLADDNAQLELTHLILAARRRNRLPNHVRHVCRVLPLYHTNTHTHTP
jgi:hypothetical protein